MNLQEPASERALTSGVLVEKALMSQTTTTGKTEFTDADTQREPISSVYDGWVLKNGDLYLLVRCSDGVNRTTIVKAKNP